MMTVKKFFDTLCGEGNYQITEEGKIKLTMTTEMIDRSKQEFFKGKDLVRYVVGFIFSPSFEFVVLTLKQRPPWQKDHYNGVGGKIEPGESEHDAMIRECREEVKMETEHWTRVAILRTPYAEVHFFYTVQESLKRMGIPPINDADEPLEWRGVKDLQTLKTVPNLQYIIPLCVNFKSRHGGTKIILPVEIIEGDADEVPTDAKSPR